LKTNFVRANSIQKEDNSQIIIILLPMNLYDFLFLHPIKVWYTYWKSIFTLHSSKPSLWSTKTTGLLLFLGSRTGIKSNSFLKNKNKIYNGQTVTACIWSKTASLIRLTFRSLYLFKHFYLTWLKVINFFHQCICAVLTWLVAKLLYTVLMFMKSCCTCT
jgi:hypothetical protein